MGNKNKEIRKLKNEKQRLTLEVEELNLDIKYLDEAR
jgi:hypothetical protein